MQRCFVQQPIGKKMRSHIPIIDNIRDQLTMSNNLVFILVNKFKHLLGNADVVTCANSRCINTY